MVGKSQCSCKQLYSIHWTNTSVAFYLSQPPDSWKLNALWQPANIMLSQLTCVDNGSLHSKGLFNEKKLNCTQHLVQGNHFCWSYKLLQEMTGKNKLRQHVSLGAEGQDELWDVMFLACGSEWNMVFSHLPGFSGGSATFSWTSLGITEIKPNQPVNVRLLQLTTFTALHHCFYRDHMRI